MIEIIFIIYLKCKKIFCFGFLYVKFYIIIWFDINFFHFFIMVYSQNNSIFYYKSLI